MKVMGHLVDDLYESYPDEFLFLPDPVAKSFGEAYFRAASEAGFGWDDMVEIMSTAEAVGGLIAWSEKRIAEEEKRIRKRQQSARAAPSQTLTPGDLVALDVFATVQSVFFWLVRRMSIPHEDLTDEEGNLREVILAEIVLSLFSADVLLVPMLERNAEPSQLFNTEFATFLRDQLGCDPVAIIPYMFERYQVLLGAALGETWGEHEPMAIMGQVGATAIDSTGMGFDFEKMFGHGASRTQPIWHVRARVRRAGETLAATALHGELWEQGGEDHFSGDMGAGNESVPSGAATVTVLWKGLREPVFGDAVHRYRLASGDGAVRRLRSRIAEMALVETKQVELLSRGGDHETEMDLNDSDCLQDGDVVLVGRALLVFFRFSRLGVRVLLFVLHTVLSIVDETSIPFSRWRSESSKTRKIPSSHPSITATPCSARRSS